MFGDSGGSSPGREDSQDLESDSYYQESWEVVAASVAGASHKRAGTPNQDAVAYKALQEGGFLACVSDGHGSSRHFRSEIGSRMAVEIGLEVIGKFLGRYQEEVVRHAPWHRILEREAVGRLPRDIVSAWRKRIAKHAAGHPLPAEAAESSSPRRVNPQDDADGYRDDAGKTEDQIREGTLKGVSQPSEVETASETEIEAPSLAAVEAYGATFLAVMVCPDFVLYMQLGDGDVVVLENGEARYPLDRDPRLLANETTSLSGLQAWKDFRVRLDVFRGRKPDLILVSTDGYSNSFETEADFLQVSQDLWVTLHERGLAYLEQNLPHWLQESSNLGSGDDVSAAILIKKSEQFQQDEPHALEAEEETEDE